MSTSRYLAIVLVACSGPTAPRPQTAAPVETAPAPTEAATPPVTVTDPACVAEVTASELTEATPDKATPDEATPETSPADDEPPRRRPPRPTNVCSVIDSNIARDAAAILAAPVPRGKPTPVTAWNHKTPPERLELVRRRFELAPTELERLNKTGVVVPARLELPSYAYGYHEIFQSQLPVYITADSLFHAIFASHDSIVERLEAESIAPALASALDRMHCALPAASADYPAETMHDLDLYLTVARSLAGQDAARSIRGDASVDREAADLIAKVRAAAGAEKVTMFGRPRLVDFTQYTPRGHYTSSEELTRYFLAAMWTSRIEFNLVSRSSRSSAPGPEPDPSETPREAIDALALADLAARSGAAANIDIVDQAWTLLAGRREDVSIGQLAELRKTAGIAQLGGPQAFAQLKRAIGDRFQRTTRLHPMPEGSTVLPAIATLIGPRIVPDAQAIMPLVNSAVPDRNAVHAADVVYSLGLDRGKHYLAKDLAAFPRLEAQLEVARTIEHTAPLGDDLYSAWFTAIRALAVTPAGALPSFATTEVGADLRFNTIAAAYGQLKHNYVLMAGQSYSEFGCEIPDGYIEPAPAAYDALIEYAARGAKVTALLDPRDRNGIKAHFERVAQTLHVIRAIVDDELANRPLTATQKRWIGMVSELSVDDSQDITGYPPVYSGWYFDLFLQSQDDGMRGADFVADYFTSVEDGIAYVGASAPRMGVFVVDTGGAPRAFVGPVARGYETHTPLGTRLTDQAAAKLRAVEDPWAASYTVADPGTRPALAVRFDAETGSVILKADHALGPATVKILDHHRVPLQTKKQVVKDGETVFAFPKKSKVGAVYVEIGAFRDWIVGDSYGQIYAEWGKLAESEE
jgi:Protein of unknown function (DUF3160)